jgi:hypothetical protein
MADESPEQIRERVFQEELDKGSEPRVAEGRAKAAELRAKQGLPIDPQEAAKAKREREGGPPGVTGEAPAEAEQAEAAPAEEAPAEEAPAEEAPAEEAPAEEAPAEEAPAEEAPEPEETPAGEAPEPEAEEAPSEELAEAPAPERPAAAVPPGVDLREEAPEAAPAPPAEAEPAEPVEVAFEPEIGEPIEIDEEALVEMAGISLRETTIPTWVTVLLLSIMAWAVLYLVVFAGSDAGGAAGCRLEADRTFTCFIEEGEEPEEEGEAPETP